MFVLGLYISHGLRTFNWFNI